MKSSAKKLAAALMAVVFMACGTGAFAAETAKPAPEQKQEQKCGPQKTQMKKSAKVKKSQDKKKMNNKKMHEKKTDMKKGAPKQEKPKC